AVRLLDVDHVVGDRHAGDDERVDVELPQLGGPVAADGEDGRAVGHRDAGDRGVPEVAVGVVDAVGVRTVCVEAAEAAAGQELLRRRDRLPGGGVDDVEEPALLPGGDDQAAVQPVQLRRVADVQVQLVGEPEGDVPGVVRFLLADPLDRPGRGVQG